MAAMRTTTPGPFIEYPTVQTQPAKYFHTGDILSFWILASIRWIISPNITQEKAIPMM